MGYDLYITRAEHWADSENSPIRLEEWIAYVASDRDMRRDGFAEASTREGATIRIESPGLAVWTAHQHPVEGDLVWLDWQRGAIVVKNPDDAMIRKMCEIATALGAHVQGDEGERYGGEAANRECDPSEKRSLWRRLLE